MSPHDLSPQRTLTLAVGLVALTLLVYIPAMRGGLVWDDDVLTENIVLKEHGVYRSWFTPEQANYWPVTWTSFWLEYQLWGLNPTGYHAVNVLVHAANALLIWRILLQLNVPGAWVAAVVFAVHPVNVESVAWIAQRKNTLSMFFFLLSLLWYLRFDNSGRRGSYSIALASFVLAMLSKGAVATLPVVLLMCVWWLRRTISRRDLLRSLPFFAVSALLSIVEIWFQYVRAIGGDIVRDDSFFARLAGAGWVVWFYLYKALLPLNLSFIYPRWRIDPTDWLSYIPSLVLIGLLWLCWRFRGSWGRAVLFGLGYFVVTLGPVLGFINFYFMTYSFVADHYQYVSIIGIIALLVAAGCRVLKQLGRGGARIVYVGATAVLVVLGLLTWRQGYIYKDGETLWRDTLRKNPNSLAHNNLGVLLTDQGKIDEAIRHFRETLRIDPSHVNAHINLGWELGNQGKLEEAIRHYHEAIRFDPNHVKAHYNLGNALRSQGKIDEAIRHYRETIRIDPHNDEAHYNLGNALRSQGKLEEAVGHYRQALQANPANSLVHNNLGIALAEQGSTDEAIGHFREALRFDPTNAQFYANLANIFTSGGESEKAIELYRRALEVRPEFAEIHERLGELLAQQGRRDEAIQHIEESLRIMKSRDTPKAHIMGKGKVHRREGG